MQLHKVLSSTVLGMTLKSPAHDTGLRWLYEDLQGKTFFTDPYIFHHDSWEWKIDLELWGWGQKNNIWGH